MFELKKGTVKIKKKKIIGKTLFGELHYSPIVNMGKSKHIFQDLPIYCKKEVPYNHKKITFFTGGDSPQICTKCHWSMLNLKNT